MTADYARLNLAALACVDPWALAEQVGSGDPEQLRGWGRQFREVGAAAADAVTVGRRADETVAAAYRNGPDAVFDARASTAEGRVLLGGGGEKMEEVARVLVDVGDALADAQARCGKELVGLAADIADTISRRNSFFADNAAALTPQGVAAAEQRFLMQAVDAVRVRGRAVKAQVDGYDAVLCEPDGQPAGVGVRGAEAAAGRIVDRRRRRVREGCPRWCR